MIKYAIIKDINSGRVEVAEGTNIEYYTSIGMTEMNVDKSEVDGNWYLFDKCPHYSEEEKEQQERERIAHLKCTKRVLALILQELGIPYSQLKSLIDSNPQAQLEWDLCVELERSNPLIDIIGEELGLTSNDIDNIFRYANGEIPNIEREGNDE